MLYATGTVVVVAVESRSNKAPFPQRCLYLKACCIWAGATGTYVDVRNVPGNPDRAVGGSQLWGSTSM